MLFAFRKTRRPHSRNSARRRGESGKGSGDKKGEEGGEGGLFAGVGQTRRRRREGDDALHTLFSSSSACRRTFASADKVPTMRLRMASAFIFYLSSSSFPCVLPLLFLF